MNQKMMQGIRHAEHSGIVTISPLPAVSMCPFCVVDIIHKRIKRMRGR